MLPLLHTLTRLFSMSFHFKKIIGLSWLVLHNPPLDWHVKNLHFETPQHKALECESLVKNM
jgi:hypothetical protein